MPGGGKGPSSQGNITQTTTNPTQSAQLPFLTSGWEAASDLYQNSPYTYNPNQTLATPNFWLPTGYNELAAAGANAGQMLPQGMDLFGFISRGGTGIQNSPAATGLSNIAYGGNPYLSSTGGAADTLNSLAGQAAANPYAGQLAQLAAMAQVPDYGMNSLQNTASGMYLNSNPYLDEMFGSASDAVSRAYQTATAPTTASNFSGAGRYGSGAYANSVSQNQQDLGSTLGNLSANIYGGNYQAERARQDAASQALSSLIAQNYGLQGNFLNQAGQQYLAGLDQAAQDTGAAGQLSLASLGAQQRALDTMQGGYQSGNQQQLQALQLFPSLMQAQYSPAQAMIQAGQGLTGLEQQVLADAEKRFYGQQQAPWTNLNQYMNAIGQPTTGSNSQTSPLLGPNPMSSALSTGTSALGLFNGLNSAFGGGGGIGSMFGKGAGSGLAGATLGSFSSAAPVATSILAPEVAALFGLPLMIASDRRLKRDIELIGTLPNGLSIYSFNYLWDDDPQIGLMADEVERVHPEAVIEGPFGLKTVDYVRAMQ